MSHHLNLQTREKSSSHSMSLSSCPCVWCGPEHMYFQKHQYWTEANMEFFRVKIPTLEERDLTGDGMLVRRVRPDQLSTQEGTKSRITRGLFKMMTFHCKHSPKEENARCEVGLGDLAWYVCGLSSTLSAAKKLVNQLQVCVLRVSLVCEQYTGSQNATLVIYRK